MLILNINIILHVNSKSFFNFDVNFNEYLNQIDDRNHFIYKHIDEEDLFIKFNISDTYHRILPNDYQCINKSSIIVINMKNAQISRHYWNNKVTYHPSYISNLCWALRGLYYLYLSNHPSI